MRLGISGKGGTGKTTISAVLARTLARRGHRVVAIDCDTDPNLAANIGLGEDGAARLRPLLDQTGPERHTPDDLAPADLVGQYGSPAPDGVTVMLGARIEKAGSGCTGSAHITIRKFIDKSMIELPDTFVIADMEAGLEHLTWAGGTLRHVDRLLVVLQPTAKVLMTASRTHLLAVELGIPRIDYVGNRVRAGDEERLTSFAHERGGRVLVFLPEDPAVAATDRRAGCLLDTTPRSPVVAGVASLADEIEADTMTRPR
ncbi:MAG TPA: AAA family ATPase [Acidimicrobiales bacterium]|nr:AAA family ATPase [Acidimicrobiales bacterium]